MTRRLFIPAAIIITALAAARCWAADPWSEADIAREAAWIVSHTIDWGQTLDIAANPDRFYETNPILGDHPDRGDVNRYFIVTTAAHIAITHLLPEGWRPAWQYVTFGISAGLVWHNYRIGLRLNF